MKVVTGEVMRELDRRTIEDIGIPGIILMEHAGYLSAEIIYDYLQKINGQKVAILVGKGNNGGDGLVVARHLYHQGCAVTVISVFPPDEASGDAAVNMKIVQNLGIPVRLWDEVDPESNDGFLEGFDLLVDALLGTGIKGEVRGRIREVIGTINDLPLPVVALDIPSGIDASSGRILGSAVRATMTVTFGFPKVGNVNQPGSEFNGRLHVVDIGIPGRVAVNAPDDYFLITGEDFRPDIFCRRENTHKGDFGRVFLLAGSRGMTGAALLSGQAVMKAGAGLAYLGIPASLYPVIASRTTELISLPYNDANRGFPGEEGKEDIINFLKDMNVAVIGPGLGTNPQTARLVNFLISRLQIPLVLDADGINCLEGPEILKRRNHITVITPHPGEMARLLNVTVSEVQNDRISVARKLAVENGIWVVLKGSRTIVSCPDGRIFVNSSGNPGMATAGSGDVLSGILGGFLASLKGLSTEEKICLSVYIHGLAGDIAARTTGPVSLLAGDILQAIPSAINSLGK